MPITTQLAPHVNPTNFFPKKIDPVALIFGPKVQNYANSAQITHILANIILYIFIMNHSVKLLA